MLAQVERVRNRKAGANGKGISTTLVEMGLPAMTAHRWQTLATVPEVAIRRLAAETTTLAPAHQVI